MTMKGIHFHTFVLWVEHCGYQLQKNTTHGKDTYENRFLQDIPNS